MLHFLPGVTIQRNDMVQAFRGNQPRFFQDERTLSKKDRGVKVFKYFKYFNLDDFTKESIIEQTYLSENLPCPLFALRARGPMGRRPKRGIPPFLKVREEGV